MRLGKPLAVGIAEETPASDETPAPGAHEAAEPAAGRAQDADRAPAEAPAAAL
ncbi:hypothetical protein [Streptomyces griseocarneus]|uniref:hypothetical protein n=1 Tax=Streptomyces griseocarneus TaxID=51201 RepID=UPI00167D9C20|nr:hypothetical protein [Streptomyces griseocarneus]MBZ6471832.1 hypothetical protein [Streptomyces griseocarneus]GHG71102.1 hypothetical protein GCM10018779_45520 [Streptomyces griseocarneus]